MIRIIQVAVIILIVICTAFSIPQATPLPEKLEWKTHFLGAPDNHSPYYAQTATRWHYRYKAKISGNDLYLDFNFSAAVDPNESWVKLDRLHSAEAKRKLLKHEQGHADINFLLLKDGEQKIRYQAYTLKNYKRGIAENAEKISRYYSDMQARYDAETQHGALEEAQKRWDKQIALELKRFIR
ncbi:hypothetical protein D9M68_699830 [compost metagenome]